MKKYIIACLLALTAGMSIATAQNKDVPKEAKYKGLLWSALHGLEYEFKAGVNFGGTWRYRPPALTARNKEHRQLQAGACHLHRGKRDQVD